MEKNLLSDFACVRDFESYVRRVWLGLFFALHFGASYAQVHLVKDIITADSNEFPVSPETSLGTDYNGIYFFAVRSKELWRSDGTGTNTFKIKEFNAISQIMNLGGSLYLLANDGVHGNEIWKSDGTESGTVLLRDINPGSGNSLAAFFTVSNGLIFFAATDGKLGIELWKTDGTTGGTLLVKDIMKGAGTCKLGNLISFNNKLYFTANHGSYGYEIWESDGTVNGTQVFDDIVPGKTGSNPNLLTVSGNYFYFEAKDANGFELWKSNGTIAGTAMVKDIAAGSKNTFFDLLFNVDGTLYFSCNDQVHGYELWKSDGTAEGTQLIKDTAPGKYSGFSWVNGLYSFHGKLVYVLGRTFYETDGTIAGTRELFQVGDFYAPKEVVELNDALYFVNYDYEVDELWKYDGTSVSFVSLIIDNHEGYYYTEVSQLAKSNEKLFFNGNNNSELLMKLFTSDGTLSGTQEVADIVTETASSSPRNFYVQNGEAYFNTYYSFWKTDGTESGTKEILDETIADVASIGSTLFFVTYGRLFVSDGTKEGTSVLANNISYSPSIESLNGNIFFSGYAAATGYELWKTDGTLGGTVLVKDINPGVGNYSSSDPNKIINVNGLLYFTATRSDIGRELWKSDGTSEGTVLVKDIYPGVGDSNPQNLTSSANGLLYFIALNGAKYQLWVSDGTSAGTFVLKDIYDQNITIGASLKVINNKLYFVNGDASTGNALWKTDGTIAGTIKVKDFYSGDENISILDLYNDKVYVLVKTSSQFALWASDGSTEGTSKIKEIGEGSVNYFSSKSIAHNGFLYFNISTSGEVWRTDGTDCGTIKIPYGGSVHDLTYTGSTFVLGGYYTGAGDELLRLDENEIAAPICAPAVRSNTNDDDNLKTESFSENNGMSNYPNPFKTTFTLNVRHPDDINFNASIIRMDGVVISRHTNLKTNSDYTMGKELASGIYLVKVIVDAKTETRRVVKIE